MPTCSSEKDGEHYVLFQGSPIQRIPAIRNILPKFLVPLPIHILYSLTAAFWGTVYTYLYLTHQSLILLQDSDQETDSGSSVSASVSEIIISYTLAPVELSTFLTVLMYL